MNNPLMYENLKVFINGIEIEATCISDVRPPATIDIEFTPIKVCFEIALCTDNILEVVK